MSDNSNVETRRKRIKDFIPSNARWFLADLLGIDKTFTEDDLTRDEMQYLKDNLSNIISDGRFVGKETVAIRPGGRYISPDTIMGEGNLLSLIKKSFDPAQSLKTSLGKSTLDLSGGQAVIKDMYDFEVEPTAYKNISFMDLLSDLKEDEDKLGAYELASFIAGKFGSDAREGEGNPVSINLGTLEDLGIGPFETDDIQRELYELKLSRWADEFLRKSAREKMLKKSKRKPLARKPLD